MLPGMEFMGCQNLAVPAEIMRHIVHVESGANPYAIGVVGARLARQPRNLEEAVATAKMLEAKGYNFSLGLAQVNRVNFSKYGLDTHEKVFDTCNNLAAGARILADCYASAGANWGKAFSCYYAGNFQTGFKHGYVQKIYDSMNRGTAYAANASADGAIPVVRQNARPAPAFAAAPASSAFSGTGKIPPPRITTGVDRVAMRSTPVDPAAVAASPPTATAMAAMTPPAAANPAQANATPRPPAPTAPGIFVPQVQGPGDPATAVAATQQPAAPTAGSPDPDKESRDSAFVF